MTAILGLSAFYHDSAVALVMDGDIVAAAQEERFTRKKHDARFPTRAVLIACRRRGSTRQTLDFVAFYEKPLTKFERLLETYLACARRLSQLLPGDAGLAQRKAASCRASSSPRLAGDCDAPLVFTDHHESHAASAFFPSPFRRGRHPHASTASANGSTTLAATAAGNRSTLTHHLNFRTRSACSTPHSPITAASRSTAANTS